MKLRLFPMMLFAATSLLTLKAFDMVFNGDQLLAGPSQAQAAGPPAKKETKNALEAPSQTERPKENIIPAQGAESAAVSINERFGEKRRALDDRNKELDLRDSLVQAAEKRLDTRMKELKDLEDKLTEAKTQEEEHSGLKIKNLVVMYETMKPKEAAAIFDNLDMDVTIEVVSRMKPQLTAQILGKMATASAQKLTVEMARRSLAPAGEKLERNAPVVPTAAKPASLKELPRIDKVPAKTS